MMSIPGAMLGGGCRINRPGKARTTMRHCCGIAAVALALMAAAPVHAQQRPGGRKLVPAVLPSVTVTVLADNMAGGGSLLGEWGLSYFVEAGQHRILFDAGQGHVFLANARTRNVDLGTTDAIVISHAHDDHTAGLAQALQATGPVDLYVHPAAFTTRYWKGDSGPERTSMPLSREQLAASGARLIDTESPTLVADGVYVTGQIPRVSGFEDTGVAAYAFLDEAMTLPDPIIDDQAMFFRVPQGVVIVLGCGHAGLVNTIRYVADLTGEDRIFAVIGGTHLMSATPGRMRLTLDALRRYDVQQIMLAHCTGVDAYAQLAAAFPGRCSWPTVGSRIRFGAQ
ncbi:MAG: MBL fold metallo-hydrolase [Gemmatimonadetes bacterium]|nr:MBL fold metallo-hydrolase [Gemmatimonadota bacterium]